jgi:hypothetical protein
MPLSLSGGRIQPPSGSTTRITGPVLLSCCAHLRAERALLRKTRGLLAVGQHAIIWTHPDEVNQALLDFIGHP